MYQPPAFKETRQEILFAAIAQHPLATLVCQTQKGLVANHLPMIVAQEHMQLHAHLSRGNDLMDICADGIEALAIFQGPSHYVSPGWYPSKKQHGKVVPTYNYVVVQARGQLRFCTDDAWKLAHLSALTNMHEAQRAEPWALEDAPEGFMARQLKGLYGLVFEITSLEGKWKVSQNRTTQDRDGVVAGLLDDGDQDAVEMAGMIKTEI